MIPPVGAGDREGVLVEVDLGRKVVLLTIHLRQ